MLAFQVDTDLCSRCGDCEKACYFEIIEQVQDHLPRIRPENESLCNQCQHCLSVCHSGALSINNKRPTDSAEIREGAYPQIQQMMMLVRGRRSIRHYKNENVSKAIIRQLLLAIANAPTGNNTRKLAFTVIDDLQTMKAFQEKLMIVLSAALNYDKKKNDWFLENIGPVLREKGPSSIFYYAPHLLIVSSPTEVYTSKEDVIIALTYFELTANCAGLGTVWCGTVKTMLESLPELKKLLNIPEDSYYFPILFGLPAIKYHRTTQRDDSAAIQCVTI